MSRGHDVGDEAAVELGERDEDEVALVETRVRHDEVGLGNPLVADAASADPSPARALKVVAMTSSSASNFAAPLILLTGDVIVWRNKLIERNC